MTLQLEIVSEHRDIVGSDAVRVFHDEGGTIGRSMQSDWILPDPDRFISGRHASIDYRGGIYYLLDTSSNGVYINGDCEPLGKGNSRRLFNGDRLRLGDFEIVVSIDAGESLVSPLEDTDIGIPDHNESLVDEDPLKTGMLLLDEDALTGDDDFQSVLFGGNDDDAEEPRMDLDLEPLDQALGKPAAPLDKAGLVDIDLIDSFLDGLGINRAEFHPTTDLAQVMQNAGEVLREFVEGTSRLLASRANMKNAFRLDQTTVLPRHNNPLKLSASSNDSIKQLLVGEEGEYLGPRDAVREVCNDLLLHQDALLDAMNAAFNEFADRFDPDELEQDFEQNAQSTFLTRLLGGRKFWPMYRDLYPIITEKGSGRFPQMYAEEFVNAYERQIAEYRRLGGHEDLRATVKLTRSDLQAAAKPSSSNDDDVAPDDDFLDDAAESTAEA